MLRRSGVRSGAAHGVFSPGRAHKSIAPGFALP